MATTIAGGGFALGRYALGRALRLLGSLVTTAFIIFVFVRLSGDPLSLMLPDTAGPDARAALERDLGLDQPIPLQFFYYMGQLIRGDFGRSFRTDAPVTKVIANRVPATLQLAGTALLLTLFVAIPLGMISASHHGSWVDTAIRALAFAGQSLPNFWVAIILVLIFSVGLGLLPAGGRTGLSSVVLPAVTMSLYAIAGIVRVLRSSMLECSRADYVTTARAKGLPESRITWRHVFRNALLPTVTYGGILLVMMFLSGSIVIETVFAWPGVGRLLYDSILSRDFPVVQGIALLFTVLYVTMSLIVDILYGLLDPRTR